MPAGNIVENGTTLKMSFIAAANVKTTTSQYKACYISASMTVSLSSTGADEIVGIVSSFQSEGSEYCTVITHGVAKGVMATNTSCVIGAWLVSDSIGVLDTAVTNTTDQCIIGRCLDVPASGGAVMVYVNVHPTTLV